MKNLKAYDISIFEKIKHIGENGNEYWLARELQKVLKYSTWQKFTLIINKAKDSCDISKFNVEDHFNQLVKMILIGKGGTRKVIDYKLSRYACYLIVMNGDSKKEVIALGQTYFAIQTRKQELLEKEYNFLTEEEKRIYQRNLTKKENYLLNQTASDCGVRNFDKFHNSGYRGLYDGECANDIAKRKNLRYREDILDNMCSDELIINLFRISQTNQKLMQGDINTEKNANETHYEVGSNIRDVIIKNGGILPEKFPTPKKSIKELERNSKSNLLKK